MDHRNKQHSRESGEITKHNALCVLRGYFSVLRWKKRYQLGDENEKKGWTNVLDSLVCWITSDNGNWNFFLFFSFFFSIPAQQLIELSDKILTRSLFLWSVLFLPFLSFDSFGTVGGVEYTCFLFRSPFSLNLRCEFDTFTKCYAGLGQMSSRIDFDDGESERRDVFGKSLRSRLGKLGKFVTCWQKQGFL